jgi:hypothetical protein
MGYRGGPGQHRNEYPSFHLPAERISFSGKALLNNLLLLLARLAERSNWLGASQPRLDIATEEAYLLFTIAFCNAEIHLLFFDRLCGLVVRVSGCRSKGPGFDSWRYQIF